MGHSIIIIGLMLDVDPFYTRSRGEGNPGRDFSGYLDCLILR